MLSRFSVNERKDIYPDDKTLALAYADALIEELRTVVNEGCTYIQFDEPVWTEDVSTSIWGAEVLNYIIDKSFEYQDSEMLEDWGDLLDIHTVLEETEKAAL